MTFDRRILAIGLAAALCSASAALADDAQPAAAAPAAAATPAPAAAPAAGQAAPAAGQPAPAAAAQPPVKVPDAVKAWAKFCDPAADGHKICIVRKLVFEGPRIMASLTIRLDSAKGVPTLAVAAIPVGLLLKPGMEWQIDNGKPQVLPFWRCTPQTCESEQLVKPDFIAGLKKGNKLTLTAKNVDGKDFAIDVPLNGFGAVYDQQNAPTFAEYTKGIAAAEAAGK